jgi:hypothetical protein
MICCVVDWPLEVTHSDYMIEKKLPKYLKDSEGPQKNGKEALFTNINLST